VTTIRREHQTVPHIPGAEDAPEASGCGHRG
jgi:hypothetical protein